MKFEDWKASRLVYSTDASQAEVCSGCGQPLRACRCKPVTAPAPPKQQKLRVRLERKGRRGKSVTVVEGLVAEKSELESLARRLKVACGSGGAIKEDWIELQGDHRDKVSKFLSELGYRPKRS